MAEPWPPGETPEEQAERVAAYERLTRAARRADLPLEKLAGMLRQITANEAEARRFLTEEVYGVSDELLDDLVRVRLEQLSRQEES
ncbi:MAG TPA: hypothetical protein VFI91_05310 [Longimicrobiaceae bacterium]|nr:hypothetical protein [Longimicrobiaceae bacterium]